MKNDFVYQFTGILFFGAVLFAACTIPFFFESPSMYYKTGMDRIMLRSGKILGIIAALLMLFQPVFTTRSPVLDKMLPLKKRFQFHRINGAILLICALIHPVLILGADHFVFFPFESRYWPEFVGVFLLALLLPFVGLSLWQKKTGLTYKTWQRIHKTMAPVILVLLFIHVMNVSRSFESGLPFYLLSAAGLILVLVLAKKYIP